MMRRENAASVVEGNYIGSTGQNLATSNQRLINSNHGPRFSLIFAQDALDFHVVSLPKGNSVLPRHSLIDPENIYTA